MITKNDVKRENLKNNFLKNIIVRFDYTGISEVELDSIIAKVKPIFKNDGYNKLKEEYLTEMDFRLQDPESIETDGLPVKEIRKKEHMFLLMMKKELNVNFQHNLRLCQYKARNIFLFPNIVKH